MMGVTRVLWLPNRGPGTSISLGKVKGCSEAENGFAPRVMIIKNNRMDFSAFSKGSQETIYLNTRKINEKW